MWDEAWKKFGLSRYGEWYCRYIDINLVQGFSNDMVMIAKTMKGLGDECCTFVNVGYEQTEESKKRIADMKEELKGKYCRDFLYHEGHFLNAVRRICSAPLKENYSRFEQDMMNEFAGIYGKELAQKVMEESEKDFDN